jgi:hypothetical protein
MKVISPDEKSKTAPRASVQKNPDPECFVVGRKIILSIIRKKKHESDISTMYDIHVESMHVVVYEGWTTSNPIYEPPSLNKKKKKEKEGLSYTFFVGKKNGCGYMECWNRIKGGWDVFTCFDSTPQKIFDAKLDLYADSIENLNMVYDHDMFKMDKRSLNPYASEDFIHHQIVANVQTDCDKIHGLVFSKVDKDSKVITTSSRKSEIGSLLAHTDEKVLLTRMREPTLLFLLDSVSRDFVPSEDLVFFRMNIASIVFISLWCACIFPYSLKRELCDKSSLLLTTLFMENDMCELAHSCIDRVKKDMKEGNKMITQEYQFNMLRPVILVGEGIISDLYSGKDMVSFEKILLMKRLFLQLSRSKVDPYPYITMILKGRDAFSCLGVNWVRDEDRCACCNKSSSNVISLLNHDSRICNMCEQSTCDSCMRGSMCRICLEPAVGLIESCLLKEEVQTLEKEKSSIDLSKKLFVKEREKNFNLQKDLEECRRTSNCVTLELETMQERLERIMKEQKSNLKQGERMKKMESENARLKKEFHILQEEVCKNKKRMCDEKVLRDEIQTWKNKFEECEKRLLQKEEEMKKSELMAVSFKEQLDTSLIDFQEEENKLLQRCVMEKKKVTSLEKKMDLMEKQSNHNHSQGKEMDVLIQVFQSTLKNIDEPDAELWRRRYEELYYSVKRRDPSFFQK